MMLFIKDLSKLRVGDEGIYSSYDGNIYTISVFSIELEYELGEEFVTVEVIGHSRRKTLPIFTSELEKGESDLCIRVIKPRNTIEYENTRNRS